MDLSAIRHIAVIGAGLMGHGIAQEFAARGYAVWLHDRTDDDLQRATRNVEANLVLQRQLGLLTPAEVESVRANLRTTIDLEQAAATADLVVEAVFEDLPLKQRIFAALDTHCPPQAILASNTSSFMPSLLAAATRRPDRVLVAHYFNPPHLLPLVELVRGAETSDETMATMHALLTALGKRPVIVQREVPGFIGNRLQIALLREALSLVAQGVATPDDVDTVVRYGFGRRLAAAGPFEIFDLAGLDVVRAVADQLLPVLDASTTTPALLTDLVARGALGAKSGEGIYHWSPEQLAAVRERIGRALIAIAAWPDEP